MLLVSWWERLRSRPPHPSSPMRLSPVLDKSPRASGTGRSAVRALTVPQPRFATAGCRQSRMRGSWKFKKGCIHVCLRSDSTQQMWLQRESGELRLHYLGKHALPAAYFVVDLPDCPRTGPVAHTFTTSLCQAAPPAQAALEPMASS